MAKKNQPVDLNRLRKDHSLKVLDETLRSVAQGRVTAKGGPLPSGTERMRAAVALVMFESCLSRDKLTVKEIATIHRFVNGGYSDDDGFPDFIGDLLKALVS